MTLYVVGFMLDEARKNVVLIQKNRPAWQAGYLNGVGGKIEGVETGREAMAREYEEEAGWVTQPADWQRICTISWPDDVERVASSDPPSVSFYRCISDEGVSGSETQTDEAVSVQWVDRIPALPVIPNLRWLIPLAAYTADRYEPFSLQATVAEVLT